MGDRMNHLAKLGAEVSASLESAREARGATSRVREKLVARRVPRLRAPRSPEVDARFAPRRSIIFGGLGLAAAAAIALAVGGFATSNTTLQPASSLSFVVGDGASEKPGKAGVFISAPEAAEMPLTFSDGSKVRLAPSAHVRVTEVARSGAHVLVESGDVHVSVVHRDDTKWSVEAGPFEVRVTGTKFDVHWDPATTALVVRLEEGAVYVRGCNLLGDEGRLLQAGEQLDVSCRDRAQHVRPIAAAASDSRATAAPIEAPTMISATALPDAPRATSIVTATAIDEPAPSAKESAVSLARHGPHASAIMSAEANGFAATCDAAVSGSELLVLADSARYAGRFERAAEALEAARRRFPGSDPAATAAFELGRIAMDVRRDLAAAGDHFETYLRERPSGGLAREALGRALEARHRSGDNVRAEPLAVRYLAAYPEGPFAKLARKINTGTQP